MKQAAHSLAQVRSQCERICHVLEREYSVLRSRNGLLGEGIDELEVLQEEKEREIAALDLMTRTGTCLDEARARPDDAREVRGAIEQCKGLQSRNHLLFGRVVHAQRRILSAVRDADDGVSLYDRGGRTRDFSGASRVERA